MKISKKLIAVVTVICSFFLAASANEDAFVTVSKPIIENRNNSVLNIDRIILEKDSTTITFDAYYPSNLWIKISRESYLLVGDKKYAAKNGMGIKLGEEFYLPESGFAQFSVSFEPIPVATQKLDFIEGNAQGAFVLEGIDLTKSVNDTPAIYIGSMSTTYEDLEALLRDAGYINYSFDLSQLLAKDYTLQIVVNEYENNELISSRLVNQVNNTTHLSAFSKESQEKILSEGKASDPERDIYTQCERLSIRFQPAQGDSIRICYCDFNNIGTFSTAFKLRKVKGGDYEICNYQIRPFTVNEITEFQFCPLLLIGSFWYDQDFNIFRFCVENEFDKNMSSESMNLIPHYYVIGIRALPK